MATTIRDVAAHAGLSVMTVSRVLNGERHVSAEARERVLKAVAELGYRRNVFARGLPGARSFLICLLVPEVIPGYVADLQLGAIQQCRAAGYHLVARQYQTDEGRYAEAVRDVLAALRPDGFIVTPPFSDDAGVLDVLDASSTPYVRFSPGLQEGRGNSITIDEVAAGREMTRLLLAEGHRRIAFIKGLPTHVAAFRRFDGYRQAMAEAGAAVEESLVVQGDLEFRGGLKAGEALLQRPDRPTAIFASNDDTALGVMVVAQRLGIEVPREISIAGFDDSEMARLCWPQLTTVRQPVQAMAATATALLIEQAGAGLVGAEHQEAQFEIVRRGTVAAPYGGGAVEPRSIS